MISSALLTKNCASITNSISGQIISYLLFATIGLIYSSIHITGSWERFAPEDESFSILVPSTMQKQVSEVETPLGILKYYNYFYRDSLAETGNFLYLVNYCDYPDGTFPADSIDLIRAFLQTSLDESVSALEGELIYSDVIRLFENPGIIWKMRDKKGRTVVKNKAFLVDNRYYSVQVFTSPQLDGNAEREKFLDSFQLN